MAKEPLPGRVKTRLAKEVGSTVAAWCRICVRAACGRGSGLALCEQFSLHPYPLHRHSRGTGRGALLSGVANVGTRAGDGASRTG